MPSDVGVSQVQQMLSDGAQLVDVLPEREYAELHLPGAINIPLKTMTGVTTGMMDRSLPVIVYCHDYQ